MKLYTHIPSTLASAAITMALAMSPAGASAQAPPPKPPAPIVESIMKTTGVALPSIGNGTIAWADLDAAYYGDATKTIVWTLRDGQPVIAATLARFVARRLESGTDAAGHPVAIAASYRTRTPARAYLVRLDTGAVRRLAFGSRARFVDDVAIDAGRVIYCTSVRRDSGRSSLWTAGLGGRTVTNSKRLRRSRRGVTFETVRADRGRIAVTGSRLPEVDNGDELPLYAGTAHGAWREVGSGFSSEGGDGHVVEAAGFSRSGRSVFVTTTGLEREFSLKRVSLVTGRTKKLIADKLGGVDMEFAYDPDGGRLLVAGDFDEDGDQIGWTKPFR